MSNINVLIGNRICKVLHIAFPAYTWETNHDRDMLIQTWVPKESTGLRGHMPYPLNDFFTYYKEWIRNPVEAAKPLYCIDSCQDFMEALRQDFLVNGW